VPLPAVSECLERVAMDIILFNTNGRNPRGYTSVLVVSDYLTRFVRLYPLRNQTAEEVAEKLIDFISQVGAPRTLLSDRGSDFLGKVVTTVDL